MNKLLFNKKLLIIFLAIFLFAWFNKASAAGSATIYVTPASNVYSVGQIFTADVVIDGAGSIFNAAKADVSVSTNLAVKDLTLGDCNFAFIKTPTTKDLPFVGVILGSYSNKCTAYRLTLQVVRTGQGYITLANGSVKSYKKAQEILSSSKNSVYTLNPSSDNQQSIANLESSQPSETPQNNLSSYNIILTIKNENGSTLPGAMVNMEYQGVGKNQQGASMFSKTSNATGTVEFTNVPKGIYKVKAQYQGKILAENVLNVEGATKSIILGIQAKKTFDQRLLLLAFIPVIVVLIALVIFIYKRKNKSTSKIIASI